MNALRRASSSGQQPLIVVNDVYVDVALFETLGDAASLLATCSRRRDIGSRFQSATMRVTS